MFDMICRLTLGHPVGFVQKHKDCFSFQQTLEERLPIVEKFAVFGEMNVFIRCLSHVPLLQTLLPSPEDTDGVGAVLGVSYFCELTLREASNPVNS